MLLRVMKSVSIKTASIVNFLHFLQLRVMKSVSIKTASIVNFLHFLHSIIQDINTESRPKFKLKIFFSQISFQN